MIKNLLVSFGEEATNRLLHNLFNNTKYKISQKVRLADIFDIKEIKSLQKISKDLKPSKIFYLSRDPIEQKLGKVHCLFWQEGIKKIFNIK